MTLRQSLIKVCQLFLLTLILLSLLTLSAYSLTSTFQPTPAQATVSVQRPTLSSGTTTPILVLLGHLDNASEPDSGQPPIPASTPSPPAKTKPLELVGHLDGLADCSNYLGSGVGSVFVEDNYAYIASGPKLSILDVSHPSRPVEVGHTILFGRRSSRISDIEVAGSLAYLIDAEGLRIVDVSDVTTPVQISFTPLPGWGEAISVAGPYAYVTRSHSNGRSGSGCGNGGILHIIDISNPLAPRLVNTITTASGGCSATYKAFDLFVSNNYVYVADSDPYGLRVMDLSNPGQPVELGNSGGWTEAMIIQDGYAYVSNGYWGGFRIVDISDPTTLNQVASYETLNSTGPLAMVGQIIYLAEEAEGPREVPEAKDGLRLLDVSNPISPTAIGFYPTPGPIQTLTIANGYAYLATAGQLHILDVSDPAKPVEVGVYDQAYTFNHFTSAGGPLYLADNAENELQVIDASQPLTPTIIATATINAKSLVKIISQPPYVYVVEKNGLRLLSMADATTPTELSFYSTGNHLLSDAVIVNNYAYILVQADFGLLLHVIDLSTPSQPKKVGDSYDLLSGSSAGTLIQTANRLYLHYQRDGGWVLALSLANPAAPRTIGRARVLDDNLSARGDYVYLTDPTEGLQVMDFSNPTSSPPVQRFLELTGYHLVFKDKFAYLVTETEGLRILDLSNPAHPVEVGAVDPSLWEANGGYPFKGITLGDDYAYLFNENSLRLLDISDPTAPHEVGYRFIPANLQDMTRVDTSIYITTSEGNLFICRG